MLGARRQMGPHVVLQHAEPRPVLRPPRAEDGIRDGDSVDRGYHQTLGSERERRGDQGSAIRRNTDAANEQGRTLKVCRCFEQLRVEKGSHSYLS